MYMWMHAIDCDLYSTPSPLVGAEFETTAYYSREYGSVCRLCPDKTITVRQAEEREKKRGSLIAGDSSNRGTPGTSDR